MKNGAADMPRISRGVLRVFSAYSRRLLHRRFHSFRILKSGIPVLDSSRPVVIFLNHPSWWDPLICLELAEKLFAERRSFGPIEAAMFKRYRFFRFLGFFGVDGGSVSGTREFLTICHLLLDSSENVLWLTPQGRFADVRDRDLRLQGGLGALAAREPQAQFVPLAIEYPFWTESRPEILVSFGAPLSPNAEPERSSREWSTRLSQSLAGTQEKLAIRSCLRDDGDWLTISQGKAGNTGIYDAWCWLRAKLRGEAFHPEHGAKECR